jgi:phosphatidylglycerophosphatase A
MRRLIVTGFGLGRSVAPGTIASMLTAALIGVLAQSRLELWAGWIVTITVLLLWPIALAALRSMDHRHGERVDHPSIVIDEIIGMSVTLLPVLFLARATPQVIAFGFLLFRFFDIAKPLGIRLIDRKNTEVSILLDDLIAGIYAGAVLWLVIMTKAMWELSMA